MSGFQGKAQYRFGESTTNTVASGATKNGGNGFSVALTYAQGPLYAAVGYLTTKAALDNNTTRSADAALTYDLKFVKLHALYFYTKNATAVKQQAASFGATVPIGAFKVIGTVARVDNKYDTNNSALHLNDANFFGLGGNYALSKRTDLYLVYSKIVNQGAAAFIIGDASNNGLFTATNVPAGFQPVVGAVRHSPPVLIERSVEKKGGPTVALFSWRQRTPDAMNRTSAMSGSTLPATTTPVHPKRAYSGLAISEPTAPPTKTLVT